MPEHTTSAPEMVVLPLAGDAIPAGAPVIAIGNFDGAHRGHAAVAAESRVLAGTGPVMALSFEPHPRAYFKPDTPFFRLTAPELRAERLGSIGFDALALLRFDAALAGTSAEDFVRHVLIGRLGVKGVVVGADFHFGKGRAGTPAFLAEAGRQHGFTVRFVEPFRDVTGAIISSSAIRAALEAGETERANRMLGYSFAVEGVVIHGAKRGRELGYPTANIALDPGCGLKHGIYAVRARVHGKNHSAVASFGRRPMFDNGAPLLEVFLLDFSGDLYGQALHVSFEHYLRGEEKFASVEALITQMDTDREAARHLLAMQ